MNAKCKGCRKTVPLKVIIIPKLSHTGLHRWATKRIDCCIAPFVLGLQSAGLYMQSSCCGHGKGDGEVLLEDDKIIKIKNLGD